MKQICILEQEFSVLKLKDLHTSLTNVEILYNTYKAMADGKWGAVKDDIQFAAAIYRGWRNSIQTAMYYLDSRRAKQTDQNIKNLLAAASVFVNEKRYFILPIRKELRLWSNDDASSVAKLSSFVIEEILDIQDFNYNRKLKIYENSFFPDPLPWNNLNHGSQ